MKCSKTLLTLSPAMLLALAVSAPVLADSSDNSQALEEATVCLDLVAQINLGPDADCKIASSGHRLDWYPEAVFVCEVEEVFDPERPSALAGKMVGSLVGDEVEFPFTAKVACGRTLNELSQPGEVLGYYTGVAFSTSITATKFDFGLREEPQGDTPEDKPDFAIAYGGAGYALVDEAGYPTGHMTQSLTVKEPKKFPKAPLSGMIGFDGMPMTPDGAVVTGRVCGSNVDSILEALSEAGPEVDDD
ncbi:MAG: hypothetical protein ABFS45_13450 [Pseudomonadota bacterium]